MTEPASEQPAVKKPNDDWKEFEAVIEQIERVWLDKNAKVTRNAEVIDVDTGEHREIDILIEARLGSATIKIGVECRKRKSKPDATWIEQLATKLSSCGLDKIIAVSHNSFTRPAIMKAAAYNTWGFQMDRLIEHCHLITTRMQKCP